MTVENFMNPISSLFNLCKHIVLDHTIFSILVICSILIIYIGKNTFWSIIHYIERIPKIIFGLINKIKISNLINLYNNKKNSELKIHRDTLRYIKMVSLEDKRCVSMQYLFNYPSPAGFRAIFNIAIQERDQKIRAEFICVLCEIARSKKEWYDFIR